jgi:hypothetical protein
VYNIDGKGARKVVDPGPRWRFEPFKAGTDQ